MHAIIQYTLIYTHTHRHSWDFCPILLVHDRHLGSLSDFSLSFLTTHTFIECRLNQSFSSVLGGLTNLKPASLLERRHSLGHRYSGSREESQAEGGQATSSKSHSKLELMR